MEDYLLLELPDFKPDYKKRAKYGYQNLKEKEKLQNVLKECSRGYCMYCYSRIFVDGKMYGQLEHAIEKNNAPELIECIPNIGLACSKCNSSFKRKGENNRKIEPCMIQKFQTQVKCRNGVRKQCRVACKSLLSLQKTYSDRKEARIILQPMGIHGKVTGEKLELQYDVLKAEFEPAFQRHTYDQKEIAFIQEHILRFHLNDPVFKTHQLQDFVRTAIDNGGKLPKYEYNNLVVELFADKIKDRTQQEILKICEGIYLAGFLTSQ